MVSVVAPVVWSTMEPSIVAAATAVLVIVLSAMVVVGGVPTMALAMAAVGAVPTAKIVVSVEVIVAVVVPVVWLAMDPSVVAETTVVPVVVLYAMVVVGCGQTMGVEMTAVGSLLAVAMAFVFRFDFPIFYTVEAPVVTVVAAVDFYCCVLFVVTFDDVVAG